MIHYIWGRSLLEGNNKDHLLSQARSELMKQVTIVSMSFRPITDTLNLDENKFDYKKKRAQ